MVSPRLTPRPSVALATTVVEIPGLATVVSQTGAVPAGLPIQPMAVIIGSRIEAGSPTPRLLTSEVAVWILGVAVRDIIHPTITP